MNNYREVISINPTIRFGKPCITGTRISVYDVLGWLSVGMSIDDIMEDYPHITRDQILACLAYSADREHHVKIVVN